MRCIRFLQLVTCLPDATNTISSFLSLKQMLFTLFRQYFDFERDTGHDEGSKQRNDFSERTSYNLAEQSSLPVATILPWCVCTQTTIFLCPISLPIFISLVSMAFTTLHSSIVSCWLSLD